MLDTFLDGSTVTLFTALIAGVVTFFASCLFPLVPTYLAYISGVSLSSASTPEHHSAVRTAALFFVAGFVSMFVLMGMTIQRLAGFFAQYRSGISQLAGIFFIALGLFLLGVFKKIPGMYGEARFDVQKLFVRHTKLHAFFTGVAFAFAWTPCIGPVLAVILYWAAIQATAFKGFLLLVTYGLGVGLPFIIVALGFNKLVTVAATHAIWFQRLTKLVAVLIIAAGVYMILGRS